MQENAGLVVPWLIGLLTFISFEALGLVYANVLKDQNLGVSMKRFMEIEITTFSRYYPTLDCFEKMSLSSGTETLIINSHQIYFYVVPFSISIISVEQN